MPPKKTATSYPQNGRAIWFCSTNDSKTATEKFNLVWSGVWILVFGLIVATKLYMQFGDYLYMLLALFVSIPYVAIPFWLKIGYQRKDQKFSETFAFKSAVWIAIFSFVGNYLWTHYFYKVLGTRYTFPVKCQLNDVPVMLYLVTFAYFTFYHTITSMILRRYWTSTFYMNAPTAVRYISSSLLVFTLGYVTAFMEAFTIASVPFYYIPDQTKMYIIGSAFYGIYFYVSFPMYYRVDEDSKDLWTISRTVIDSLAATMAVTLLLDFWRLILGGIADEHTSGLPWLNHLQSQ